MLTAPQIIQTEVQHAAIIHLTIPRSEMRSVFGPASESHRSRETGSSPCG